MMNFTTMSSVTGNPIMVNSAPVDPITTVNFPAANPIIANSDYRRATEIRTHLEQLLFSESRVIVPYVGSREVMLSRKLSFYRFDRKVEISELADLYRKMVGFYIRATKLCRYKNPVHLKILDIAQCEGILKKIRSLFDESNRELKSQPSIIQYYRYWVEKASGDPDTIMSELNVDTKVLKAQCHRDDEDIVTSLKYIATLDVLEGSNEIITELEMIQRRLFSKKSLPIHIVSKLESLGREFQSFAENLSNFHTNVQTAEITTVLKKKSQEFKILKCSHVLEMEQEILKQKISILLEICQFFNFFNENIDRFKIADNMQVIAANFYLLTAFYWENPSNEFKQIPFIRKRLQMLTLCSEQQKKAAAFKMQLILLDLQFLVLIKKFSLPLGIPIELKELIVLYRKKARKLNQSSIKHVHLIQHNLQSLIMNNNPLNKIADVVLQTINIIKYDLFKSKLIKSVNRLMKIFHKSESIFNKLQSILNIIKSNELENSQINQLEEVTSKLHILCKKRVSEDNLLSLLCSLEKDLQMSEMHQQAFSLEDFQEVAIKQQIYLINKFFNLLSLLHNIFLSFKKKMINLIYKS